MPCGATMLIHLIPKQGASTCTLDIVSSYPRPASNQILAAAKDRDIGLRITIAVLLQAQIGTTRSTHSWRYTFVARQSLVQRRIHTKYLHSVCSFEHGISPVVKQPTKKPVSLVRDRLLATVTTYHYPRVTAKRNWPRFSQKKKPAVINMKQRWMDCEIFCINVFPKYQRSEKLSNVSKTVNKDLNKRLEESKQ